MHDRVPEIPPPGAAAAPELRGTDSPLRHVNLTDPRLTTVAGAHNVSTAAVALRWINQQGVVVATSPGSNERYAREDLNIGSFTLSAAEMARLSQI